MKRCLLLYVLAIFILNSCVKEGQPISVKGKVTNILTGEPVADIPVNIYGCTHSGSAGSLKCNDLVKTVYTDIAGNYSADIVTEKNTFYEVRVGQNQKVSGTANGSAISPGKENVVDFSQHPYKIIEVKFKASRPNRNYLLLTISSCDAFDYYSDQLYYGPKINTAFDAVFYRRIEAGRMYRMATDIFNKTAQGNNADEELLYKDFMVPNIDTTRISWIIP